MKAPKYAYIQDVNGDFFKVVITDGQLVSTYAPDPIITRVGCFVARYFQGAEADGGYSPTAELMKYNVLRIFHLDDIKDIGVRDPDNGTCRVIGFIGMVDINGPSAKYHNLDKRGSGYKVVRSTKTLMMLNDAGLNTRPVVDISFSSLYANYIMGTMTVRAGFYVPTTGGTYQRGTFDIQTGTVPKLKARESWSMMLNETSNSEVSTQTGLIGQYSGPVTGGKSGLYQLSSDSDEGQSQTGTTITTLARIIVPRPTFDYSTSEPSSLPDIQHDGREIDMFESDAMLMHSVQQGNQAAPTDTPALFNGGGSPSLTTGNLAPTGWYHSQLFDTRSSDQVKVFYVENGYAQYFKYVARVSGTWGVVLQVAFETYGSSGTGWPSSPGGSWKYRVSVLMSYEAASGNPQDTPPDVSLSDFTLRTARSQGGASEQILQFSASSIADTLSISDSKRTDQSSYIYANNDNNLNLTMYISVQSYSVVSNSGGLSISSDVTSASITGTSGGTDPDPTPGGGTDPGGADTGA